MNEVNIPGLGTIRFPDSMAETAPQFDLKEYRELCRAEEEQSRAMSSLATRMRITQQATVHPEKSRRPAGVPSAYDSMGGDDDAG